MTRQRVEQIGVPRFLMEVREELRAGGFRPLPVRERLIPKRDGRMRRLGIPTLRDRVVQMALKLVLEPIFEIDFYPSSYGFRPGRRTQDAIAEIVHFTRIHVNYEWIIEADIEACFDRIDHAQLMGEVRRRVEDKRVLLLVRSFLKAGVMVQTGVRQASVSGTPQGGIVSPLLANIALSALDRSYQADWRAMDSVSGGRRAWRRNGHPTYRLVRYADDFVVVVKGSRDQAQALLEQLSGRVQALGLKLQPEKTGITHIHEGFVFLGQRIVRLPKGHKRFVYTFVGDEALASIKHKVKALTRHSTTNMTLSALLKQLNPVLRGWSGYFRHASAKRTFCYLGYYAWWRVLLWLRKKHPQLTWKQLRRRYYGKDRIREDGIVLYNPATMRVERYRFRGAQIPTPWNQATVDHRGGRHRRADHDEHATLGHLQEALA